MRHVILRDDDTNALTPPECLEKLYRPFLDRGLPMSVRIETTGTAFVAGTPSRVFGQPSIASFISAYDVSKTGRLLILKDDSPQRGKGAPASLVVVEHWVDELTAHRSAR